MPQAIHLLLFTMAIISVDGLSVETTYDRVDEGFQKVFEGNNITMSFLIRQDEPISSLDVELVTSDSGVFTITPIHESFQASDMITFNATVFGVSLGVESLTIKISSHGSNVTEFEEIIKVLRKPTVLNFVFTYFLIVMLIVSYISMGVKLDLKVIWSNIRRPVAISIGMFCQFIVMPLLAYGIANMILSGSRQSAVGLLVEGSSPGGWFSNIFTLLLDCDFILSLTMTFCSTLGALAFMPLNLFLYAATFIEGDEALKTPFLAMIQQLALMLVPVIVGIVIRYKTAKIKNMCLWFLKPLGWFLVVVSTSLGVPSNVYVYQGSWHIWVVCFLYPLAGGLLGAIISKIAKREWSQVMTIALETGVQNSVLATTVIRLSYPQPEADLISRIPLLITTTSLIEGCSLVFAKMIYRRFCKKKYDAVNEEDDGREGNEEKTTTTKPSDISVL